MKKMAVILFLAIGVLNSVSTSGQASGAEGLPRS
jgi:hypothetical protein